MLPRRDLRHGFNVAPQTKSRLSLAIDAPRYRLRGVDGQRVKAVVLCCLLSVLTHHHPTTLRIMPSQRLAAPILQAINTVHSLLC